MGGLAEYSNRKSVMGDYNGEPLWQPEYEREPALEQPMLSPDDLIGSGIGKLLLSALGPLGLMALKGGAKSGTNAAMRGQLGAIGKEHTDTMNWLAKGVPDEIEEKVFGVPGYSYFTPQRPFENSQASNLGVKTTPLAERVFQTQKPLTAAQMARIDAVPVSPEAHGAFARELADEGLIGAMHKDGKRFSVALPSTKGEGFQATMYDPKGAIGDKQYSTMQEAVEDMLYSGYSRYLPENRLAKLIDSVMLKK